tara:strand:- start:697 stop:1386 length:690 start_codon:yes stop_codon:yes gene_type:complete
MKINTALILCAGFGKRLNPLTLKTPKPLLQLNGLTMLENCINMIIKLGIKKILLNTFHLSDQIFDFVKKKKFPIDIKIIKDGKNILNTGGGIVNMIHHSNENDFLIFNPDTLWSEQYNDEINKMQNYYFKNKLSNILLVVKNELSFDKNFNGDFELKKNLLNKSEKKNCIYIGCQILNKRLLKDFDIANFSIMDVWKELLKKNDLNGYESINTFKHLTNLETFKKLKDL